MEHLGVELADLEALTVLEQMIEVAAVGFQISGIEDRAKNALHILDMLADANLGPGLRLHIGRAGQVVGMGMSLECPGDAIAFIPGEAQHRFHRAGINLAGAGIVVEHRIDKCRLFGGRVGNNIADRVSGLVKERVNNGFAVGFPVMASSYLPPYISAR